MSHEDHTKYTRSVKMPRLPPCIAMAVYAVWKGVAFGCGQVTTERWDQFWWWFESLANIQFQKHWCSFVKWIHTDRNGPEALVNRKNIEPVVRNILVILLPPRLASSSSIVIHWTRGSPSWMTSTSFAWLDDWTKQFLLAAGPSFYCNWLNWWIILAMKIDWGLFKQQRGKDPLINELIGFNNVWLWTDVLGVIKYFTAL